MQVDGRALGRRTRCRRCRRRRRRGSCRPARCWSAGRRRPDARRAAAGGARTARRPCRRARGRADVEPTRHRRPAPGAAVATNAHGRHPACRRAGRIPSTTWAAQRRCGVPWRCRSRRRGQPQLTARSFHGVRECALGAPHSAAPCSFGRPSPRGTDATRTRDRSGHGPFAPTVRRRFTGTVTGRSFETWLCSCLVLRRVHRGHPPARPTEAPGRRPDHVAAAEATACAPGRADTVAGETVSTDRLIADLWGESAPASATGRSRTPSPRCGS